MNCGSGEDPSNNSVTRRMGCSITPQYELQGRMWGFVGGRTDSGLGLGLLTGVRTSRQDPTLRAPGQDCFEEPPLLSAWPALPPAGCPGGCRQPSTSQYVKLSSCQNHYLVFTNFPKVFFKHLRMQQRKRQRSLDGRICVQSGGGRGD